MMGSRFLKRWLRRHVGFWLRGGFFASREDGSVVGLLSPFLVREVLFCVGVRNPLLSTFNALFFFLRCGSGSRRGSPPHRPCLALPVPKDAGCRVIA